jgi:hypothetical protein
MSVPALVAKAREHWSRWLPERVAELKREGRVEESLLGAARLCQKQIDHLMKDRGYREWEAEEVALPQFILVKPEEKASLQPWERKELAERERELMRNPPVIM